MPSADDFSAPLMVATEPAKYEFMVLKFSGLPPNTIFGKIYIDIGVSFIPTDVNIGIFKTEVRGGYPAT